MYKMNNRAFTIVEALLGGILITILALGGAGFNVQMRRKMQYLQERYAAVSLASSQIEDLRIKAQDNFSTSLLDVGQDYASTLASIPDGLTVTYDVTEEGDWDTDTDIDYKIITAICKYDNDTKQIQLTTYIVDIE